MNKKIKCKMTLICLLGVFLGPIINRMLSNYFGDNGSNIAMAVSGTIVVCAILILIVIGYYMVAIISVVMAIPMIVGGIGLYLNNMDAVGFGILLIFIIYPVLIKVIPKLKHDR